MSTAFRVISELAEDEPSFDVRGDAIAELTAAEDAHFWHRTRNRIIADKLARLGLGPCRLVELGCGAGAVAAHLSARGHDVVGVEGHRRLVEIAAERAPSASFWVHDLRRGTHELPVRDFDVAALFDVLEHLDEPVSALENALTLVRPRGFVVGTVPASMRLWSAVDERAGHKLRYSRRSLQPVLGAVRGAEVVEITPFFRTLVPLLLVQRRIFARKADAIGTRTNLSVPPKPINAALARLAEMENALSTWLDRLPVEGASLWFALRKLDEGRVA